MNLDRRAFLDCIRNALILGSSLTAVPMLAKASERPTHRILCPSRPPTLAQEYLSIESAIGATAADCNDLAGVMQRTLLRSQPTIARLNLVELRKWEAVDLLNRIGESLNQEGFRFTARSTLLSTSLRARILACHYVAAFVFSLGEEIGLPLSMVKVPAHVFLRLRLRNGEELNWDIYLPNNGISADDEYYRRMYRFDRQTARRGGYLDPLSRPEMLALEYNALGAAWTIEGEWNLATENFSKAIDLDSRMAEAFKNRGAAKCRRAAAISGSGQARVEEMHSAIADLQQALKINHNYAEALYDLSLAHFTLNELDAARHFLSAAEKLNPDYSRSMLSLALRKN